MKTTITTTQRISFLWGLVAIIAVFVARNAAPGSIAFSEWQVLTFYIAALPMIPIFVLIAINGRLDRIGQTKSHA
jgi:uncharacterized membrane protein